MLATLLLAATISQHALKAHVDFLSSDLLEGRETATRGYDIAAQYVASQFDSYGLQPAGDNGTWLQTVQFRTYKLEPAQSSFCIGSGAECVAFEHRKDVLIMSNPNPASSLDAEVIFVGFGITAPELNHDDYANLDVRGKTVAYLSGAPPTFPHSQRAHYSAGTYKWETAVAHGAIGFLAVRTNESERRFNWERTISGADAAAMRALDRRGNPMEVYPQLRGGATLGPNASAELFRGEQMELPQILADAEQGRARTFPLKKRVSIHTTTTLGEATSPNVVGMIRGSTLPNEYVVLSAHLDHLGMAASGTDRVRNGALDNGSGIAALLEIARSIASMKTRPKRSIVFLALTAEEKGTMGSLAFADHPSVDGDIVANVNMDMLTMLFPVKSLVALGIEHSTLGPMAREAARKAGFTLQPDPQPEEVRFIRSDQFSFVMKGIPAITYKGGLESLDPTIDGDKLVREWLRTVYHSVRDERTQAIDYESGVRWALANQELVLMIANAAEKPRWNRGDFFGTKFGRERREKQ